MNSHKINIHKSTGHQIAMLGTIMNALVLRDILVNIGVKTKVMSAFSMTKICDTYQIEKAKEYIKDDYVLIFGGGTGNPFFTTDTGAILRAIEIQCDIVIKGTGVDGVYSDDPKTNLKAKRYDKISYQDILKKELKIMDSTAISLAKDNKMPICIYSMRNNNLKQLFDNKCLFSLID